MWRQGAGYALQAKGKVKKLTEKLQNHDLESQPGRTLMESFESQVRAAHCLPALLQRLGGVWNKGSPQQRGRVYPPRSA